MKSLFFSKFDSSYCSKRQGYHLFTSYSSSHIASCSYGWTIGPWHIDRPSSQNSIYGVNYADWDLFLLHVLLCTHCLLESFLESRCKSPVFLRDNADWDCIRYHYVIHVEGCQLFSTLWFMCIDRKCENLVSLSTITYISLWLCCDFVIPLQNPWKYTPLSISGFLMVEVTHNIFGFHLLTYQTLWD